ncbi:MAG: DUF1513 domain-containing protein [Myxococcales bacterium]|nr:DUF1513 domain-containing protein [Myxococcales bacterium]
MSTAAQRLEIEREFGENTGATFAGGGRFLVICRGEPGDPMEVELIDLSTGAPKWKRDAELLVNVFAVGSDAFALCVSETLYADDSEPLELELQIRSLDDGELLTTIPATELGHIADRPEGDMVALSHDFGPLELWDARSGEMIGGRAAEGTRGVAFSSDGRILAVRESEAVVILDPEEPYGEPVRTLSADEDGIELAFQPGTSLLAVDQDQTITLVDARTGQVRREIATTEEERVNGIGSLVFSPDGKWLLTATRSQGLVGLWDVERARFVGHLVEVGDDVNHLEFHPDGRRILIASFGAATVYRLSPT